VRLDKNGMANCEGTGQSQLATLVSDLGGRERSSCMNDTKGIRMDGTLAHCVGHFHYRLPWLRIRRTEVPGPTTVARVQLLSPPNIMVVVV
jgi:hypothetical protein